MHHFSQRLKELRNSRGWTQRQLASLLSVTIITVQRYEYGDRVPCLDQLITLANIFRIPLDDLVGREVPSI